MKNLLNAPWKKSNSLSETVKSESGELIAVIYGRTEDERRARTAAIAATPRLLHALETILPHLEKQHDGDGGPHWPAELVRAAIAEATPL